MKRDLNILLSYRKEILMAEKVVRNKKKYTRKTKHKRKGEYSD